MMKRIIFSFLLSLGSFVSFGQILNPIHWSWKAEEISKGEYKLIFTAKIDPAWHTYSQYIADGGPVKTAFIFEINSAVELIGKTTERGGKVHEGHDPVFDMQLKQFEDEMICEQKVRVKSGTKLKGILEFMACDDHQCLPPEDLDFEFDLNGAGKGVNADWDTSHSKNIVPINSINDQKISDSIVQANIEQSLKSDSAQNDSSNTAVVPAVRFGTPLSNCGEGTTAQTENQSIWMILLLGFLGGLLALITPCVFPMIPLTVSFFTKRSENIIKGRFDALFYAFCIVFIYFLISLPFALSDSASDTLNELSTGAPLNVFFFLIFLVFAISFLGYFEITLPAAFANRADSASSIGGFIGIFFMAVTLAIVSFSCTGPILGTLLVGALTAANGKVFVVAGMTAFGVGLALPFGFFAFFPNLMKKLPKSGGWLDSVKKFFGFVELILAFKFLSNADLVAHWGILKREIFLGIWALIGLLLVLHLLGKLKLPHDVPVTKLSPVRISVVVLALLFTVYSAYGIPGNDLHLFSGFPPPKFYSLMRNSSDVEPVKNEYEKALEKARAENKPVMIDFTGWACVNCRKMEENVWIDNEVKKRLTENYLVVSLYVDDKEKLPESEQRVSEFFKGKKIKTVGNSFSEMQAKYFGANSQPYYVLISPDEKLLNKPRGYTPDAAEYVRWLDCGLDAFKNL